MDELLKVEDINVYYGSIHAIKDVSFHVDEGTPSRMSPSMWMKVRSSP